MVGLERIRPNEYSDHDSEEFNVPPLVAQVLRYSSSRSKMSSLYLGHRADNLTFYSAVRGSGIRSLVRRTPYPLAGSRYLVMLTSSIGLPLRRRYIQKERTNSSSVFDSISLSSSDDGDLVHYRAEFVTFGLHALSASRGLPRCIPIV